MTSPTTTLSGRSAIGFARRAPLYPVSLDIADQPVLVVGGGEVGTRKVERLVEAGADVTVVAPVITERLGAIASVRHFQREYRRGEAASYRLVITATGIAAVDSQVVSDARATGIPVNSVDDPQNCSFTLPAIARVGDLQIAVSTGGRSPAMASWIRDWIARDLDDAVIDSLGLIAEIRDQIRRSGRSTETAAWRRALDSGLVDLVAAGHLAEARELLIGELAVDGFDVDFDADVKGQKEKRS